MILRTWILAFYPNFIPTIRLATKASSSSLVDGKNKSSHHLWSRWYSKPVDHFLRAYKADIQCRTNGLDPIDQDGFWVHAHEFSEETIYKDDIFKVEAFGLAHGGKRGAFRFRFLILDKVIVVSGDTAPDDNIPKYYKEADAFIHEEYSQKGFIPKESGLAALQQDSP